MLFVEGVWVFGVGRIGGVKLACLLEGGIFGFGLGYDFSLELLVAGEGAAVEGGALFEELENVDAHDKGK